MLEHAERSKTHQKYKIKSGRLIPGVTTITKYTQTEMGGMVYAAWKLGTNGINYRKHWDELADVGTLTHHMILCHLRGNQLDTTEYSQREIDQAANCFRSYLAWESEHTLEPILLEHTMISELYEYGGMVDFLGNVDELLTILDFKTGKTYPEHWYQLAGYTLLAIEQGYYPDNHRLIRIGREKDEEFEEPQRKDLTQEMRTFLQAVALHYQVKKVKK